MLFSTIARKNSPTDRRKEMYDALVVRSTRTKGRLTREIIAEVAAAFSVSKRTVSRIWQHGNRCFKRGDAINVFKKRSNCGRKSSQLNLISLHDIPVSKRATLDDLSSHLKVSKSTVWRHKKEGLIKRHSNSIKPLLKGKNKKERMRWCIFMLDQTSIFTDPIFRDFSDIIFIDEKWFYMTRTTERYYLLLDEDEPLRTCKSKTFIPKVMFLCAIARPRTDNEGNCTVDGKIRCFPLVTYETAKRSSKNRVAGTLEMKPITSIMKEVMRSFIIEKILHTIRAKWPSEDAGKPIFIHQDNARPHIDLFSPFNIRRLQKQCVNLSLLLSKPSMNIHQYCQIGSSQRCNLS